MNVRGFLKTFEPYEWEPSNEQIASSLGLRVEQIYRFDTNTSPYRPEKWLKQVARILPHLDVHQYPDTSYLEVRRLLAQYTNTEVDQVLVTNGGDEALDIIVKTYIDAGCKALISTPTYTFFRVVTQLMGGQVVSIPRKEGFKDDVEGLLQAVDERTRLIFLCSPNNPSGNTVSRDDLILLLKKSGCVVVVDEAYYEFSGKTVVDLASHYDNLIVVRTFSKAFSMAGIRVGYMISSKTSTNILNKVRPPNSLSVISLALAQTALKDLDTMKKFVEDVVKERERCITFLEKSPNLHVYPSEANFILIKFLKVKAREAYQRLLEKGLVTRDVSHMPGLEGCLRFSLSLPKENDILLKALVKLAG